MTMKHMLSAAAAASACALFATSTPEGWTDDFDAAKAQAKSEGKLLLVDTVEAGELRGRGAGVACQAREVVSRFHRVAARAGLGWRGHRRGCGHRHGCGYGRGRGRCVRGLRGRQNGRRRLRFRCDRCWLWRGNAGRFAGPYEKKNDEYVYGNAACARDAPCD